MAVLCPVPKTVYSGCNDTLISRHSDYFKPLHVDCSVEYELPSYAKPLHHSSSDGNRREPLLMIHPSYYRREEGRHRDPFVINLPSKLRSLEDWRCPMKVTKNHNTVITAKRLQHRKRVLDLSPSTPPSLTSDCPCGKSHSRALPTTLTSSSVSNDGCPCGEVHQPVIIEPIDATVWSNCGATVEDLRTDKRLTVSSATIGSILVKSDRNNNNNNNNNSNTDNSNCDNGAINDKFRKLRRLQAYIDAKERSAASKCGAIASASAFAMVAPLALNRDVVSVSSHSSVDVYDATSIKKAKTDMYSAGAAAAAAAAAAASSSSSTFSFEYRAADAYPPPPSRRHRAIGLYEPQPAVAATAPAVVPMASHWNCGGYYRTAGANAISTIVRDSENMWRLFQV